MKPAAVTAEFHSWVGVPWVHQGRTRFGIDCAGLIVMALGNLGLIPKKFEDPVAYGREPQAQLALIVERWCEQIPLGMVEPSAPEGTLILLRWSRDQEPSHLAYCTGRNLIHAYSRHAGRTRDDPTRQTGRVIEHRYGEPWLRQTTGVYKIPGVDL